MVIAVDVRGVIRVSNKLNRLAPNVQKAGMRLVNRTAKFIYNSAKRRAPFWRGDLKRSIFLRKKGPLNREVGSTASYARLHEQDLPIFQSVTPLMREWAIDHGYLRSLNKKVWLTHRWTPFLTPAANKAITKIPRWTRQYVRQSIRRAGFRGG